MSVFGTSISPSKLHNIQIIRNPNKKTSKNSCPPPKKSLLTSSYSSSFNPSKLREKLHLSLNRRVLNLSISGFLLSFVQPISEFLFLSDVLASQVVELQRYTDSKEGFTLLIPASWIKVDKAGATLLFEDVNKKANNVGVVVIPTRISTLGEFGTPQFVADKLIQAERKKESTKDAEVVSVSERTGHGGLLVYEFEYKVDSTRGGLKRVLSAAFVTSKKLYLLNITHSDGLENPLDADKRMLLEQIMHSFDAVPTT